KGVRLDPNVKDGNYYLGIAYTAKENYKKAIECFAKAEKQNPTDPQIYQFRSGTYSIIGRNDLALKDLNTLIKMRPKNEEHLVARAGVYKLMKQYDKALADYN